MDFKVFLTSRAHRDLFAIWRYIAKADPETATRFCTELNRKALSLSTFPNGGVEVPRRKKVRRIVHENYLIYYRVHLDTKTVQVLRFRHSARDEGRMRLKEPAAAYPTRALPHGKMLPGEASG